MREHTVLLKVYIIYTLCLRWTIGSLRCKESQELRASLMSPPAMPSLPATPNSTPRGTPDLSGAGSRAASPPVGASMADEDRVLLKQALEKISSLESQLEEAVTGKAPEAPAAKGAAEGQDGDMEDPIITPDGQKASWLYIHEKEHQHKRICFF